AESYYSLARLYQSNKLPAENRQEMVYVNLIRASLHGSAPASYELGLLALQPPEADHAQAALYFHSAALAGHDQAQLELGRLYEQGKGVRKSLLLAKEFYQKAADQNNAGAQTALGILLITDPSEKNNLREAEKYLQAAADAKYPKAFTALGYIKEKQFSNGKTDADAQAGIYYRKAAALEDPEGLVNYGDWLMNHERKLEALENYRTAAEKHSFAPALHRMGVYYFKQTTPDYKLSRKYFERAAAKGYAASWRNLGIMAEMGHGESPDPKRARECYNTAEALEKSAGK
ncbi:MAG: sel1 repeat family protein, partial [Lentisphaeria bacterium]|nr:sel1 repeat family protein [Lentisphaeria bacterium]